MGNNRDQLSKLRNFTTYDWL